MAPVTAVIETFEQKAKRILWLPPITLGYIFTLSGFIIDFGLAVAAIGGAQLFSDLIDSEFVVESDMGKRLTAGPMAWLQSTFSGLKLTFYAVIALLYAISAAYGLWQLYLHFDHNNPVLVGLSGIYWGILIVIIMNM